MMKLTIAVLCTFVCAYAGVISNDWRIVGGQEADDGQFPYQISLRDEGRHICGGSILDENTILMAAHCVQTNFTSHLYVVVGTNHISEGGASHQVKSIHRHPKFQPLATDLENDIAILKLVSNIEFNDKVQKIGLEEKVIGGDVSLVLSGWGRTSNPGDAPSKLQFIKLVSLTAEKCQKLQTTFPIIDSQICTLTKEGEGPCKGDSGGPLVSSVTGNQVGIVSWGTPCAKGFPDVYTRISSFMDWIEETRNATAI